MKKIIKSRMFYFILGFIIAGSVGVYAATQYSASQITYNKNGQATVEEALNDLYKKNVESSKVLLFTSSWKGGKSWLDGGISDTFLKNDDYITVSSGVVTFKKDCNIKVTGFMRNTNSSSSAPQYKLYHNNQSVLSFSNGTAEEVHVSKDVELTIKANDTMYVSMYGGGSPTYYITYIELLD